MSSKRNSLLLALLLILALFGSHNVHYVRNQLSTIRTTSVFDNIIKANQFNSSTNDDHHLQEMPSMNVVHQLNVTEPTSTMNVDKSNKADSKMESQTHHDIYNNNLHDDFLLLKTPQVMFDDLKYRRVCAHVHSSILCLVLLFPFEVPLQDATVTFPKPFPPNLDILKTLIMIDGPLLEKCRNATTTHQHDDQSSTTTTITTNRHHQHMIQTCFKVAQQHSSPRGDHVVMALWTRQRASNHPKWSEDQTFTLYGTKSEMQQQQQQRVRDFFHNHVILVLGASPTFPITSCLTELLGPSWCQRATKNSYTCSNPTDRATARRKQKRRPAGTSAAFGNPSEMVWSVYRYFPTMMVNETLPGHVQHIVNTTMSLMEFIRNTDIAIQLKAARQQAAAAADAKADTNHTLRPLSIIVDFPLAHTQTHYMMTEMMDQVKYNQERMVELIMNVATSPAAREELAELGLELSSTAPLIVFDGQPQFFPSESGGYLHEMQEEGVNSEEDFLQVKGYPGWRPELGSSCRGPLPRNSPLRHVNDLERNAFFQHRNFSSLFYGKTFDFANQFWWQTAKWRKTTQNYSYLDCVHSVNGYTGLSCVHKFFLQSMIDDHYEIKALSAAAATTATIVNPE